MTKRRVKNGRVEQLFRIRVDFYPDTDHDIKPRHIRLGSFTRYIDIWAETQEKAVDIIHEEAMTLMDSMMIKTESPPDYERRKPRKLSTREKIQNLQHKIYFLENPLTKP